MKKKFIYLTAMLSALISFSCEENFQPKATFEERFVLTSVVRGDSTVQIATLQKTYDVEGFDPTVNHIDMYISGAAVYLRHDGNVYPMHDTLIQRTDTSRYKEPFKAYVGNGLKPSFNDSIEIVAVPVDGVTLSAKTKVPAGLVFTPSTRSLIEKRLPFIVSWSTIDIGNFYLPRLKILYRKRSENLQFTYIKEVPLNILEDGTKVYPDLSRRLVLNYEESMIDNALLSIADEISIQDIKVIRFELEVLMFDQFLSNYISTTNGFFDDISIRLDEPNYTNIQGGGFGFFGATMKTYLSLSFTKEYIESLGFIF